MSPGELGGRGKQAQPYHLGSGEQMPSDIPIQTNPTRRDVPRFAIRMQQGEASDQIPEQAGHITDVSPARPSAPERTPAQKRLFKAVAGKLAIQDAITATFDPAKGRTGDIRLIVIDSADGKTHIALDASAQGEGINEIGLEKRNNVKLIWWDEVAGQTGAVDYVDRPDELSFNSRVDTYPMEPRHIQYWRETGGIEWLAGGVGSVPAATEDQLNELAAKIDGGHTNVDMTNGAMRHLQTTRGAQRIADSSVVETSLSSTPPELPPTK